MGTTLNQLLTQLQSNFPKADVALVEKAFAYAQKAHEGQFRLSGEPYIEHPLEVACILADLGLDPVTCAAALLHDILEDTHHTREELAAAFGHEIAALVEAVTKISTMTPKSDSVEGWAVKQAQNIRKMLVATARDIRVILIKLADRLHNMRTLSALPWEKRLRISRETLEIYAPLAHRLGISRWKWELEDHAFHYLHPLEYEAIAKQVAMKRRDREAYLADTIAFLQKKLNEKHIAARVTGRPKHLYSIYQKMQQQGKTFEEVTDVLGVRIITQGKDDCYAALGVVHSLWTPVPGRFKDYIAMPKLNMYRALHTTIMRENGRPMEVQIRSEEMDREANEGIAAHWIYKEGEQGRDPRLDEQLAWLRKTYDWLKDAQGMEMLESMKRDFRVGHIYVFTPKGEVKELPEGATPVDFAYMIHSEVGHHCIGARINGKMVSLRHHLQTGDVVEIITAKNQTPHSDWLEFVVSGRARTRIRQRLRELGKLEPVSVESKPDALLPETRPPAPPLRVVTPQRTIVRKVDEATRAKLIRIQGLRDMAVHFARCCEPMPGHPVVGYVTRFTGITVHRADCKMFLMNVRDKSRVVDAFWEGEGVFETSVRAITTGRPNMLADITHALRGVHVEILKAHYGINADGKYQLDFAFEAHNQDLVERVLRVVRSVVGVVDVSAWQIKEKAPRSAEGE